MADSPLELRHDFECANVDECVPLGPAAFRLRPRPDDASNGGRYADAGYYFAARLHNPNAAATVATITVQEPGLRGTGRTVATRLRPAVGRAPLADWQPMPQEQVQPNADADEYSFCVPVPPKAAVDVSTMYWYAASEIAADLDALTARYPAAIRRESVATTAEGRDVPLVDLAALAPPSAPTLALAATPQCHECGSIAVMGLLAAALKGELADLAARCRLVFLPLTNPDGNAHGNCMANARRQNLVFGFGPAGGVPDSPECAGVWRAVASLRPDALVEWHSYPHLNRPSFRPYELAGEFYPDPASRARGERFAAVLRGVSPHPPVPVAPGTEMADQFAPSLIVRLVTERGIPATLYKLHNRESIAANVAHALAVTRAVAESLRSQHQ